MNSIRATRALNQRELDAAVPPSASWHVDYRDTAYIYIGGLPLDLSEGDITTIFSQYGNPTHLNLVREKDTGKSRGFAFLKYEDQRSCDLAVDNLGGAEVLGRLLRVDHSRYKRKDGETEDDWRIERLENENQVEATGTASESGSDGEKKERRREKKRRKVLKEEKELEEMLAIKADGEPDEDPMREYLIREKKDEVERARNRATGREKEKRRRHKHKHHHRSRDEDKDKTRDGDGSERDHSRERRSHRHRDRDDADEDSHRSRRYKDRNISTEDGSTSKRRQSLEDDSDAQISDRAHRRRPRSRDREYSEEDKVTRSRHAERDYTRRRSRSLDPRQDKRRPSRSRSPAARKGEYRDRNRDKESSHRERKGDYGGSDDEEYRQRSDSQDRGGRRLR